MNFDTQILKDKIQKLNTLYESFEDILYEKIDSLKENILEISEDKRYFYDKLSNLI